VHHPEQMSKPKHQSDHSRIKKSEYEHFRAPGQQLWLVLQAGFSVAHSPRSEVLCRNAQFLGWQRSESEEPAERALCWAFSICNGSQGLLPRLSKTRFLMSIYELPSSQHQVNINISDINEYQISETPSERRSARIWTWTA